MITFDLDDAGDTNRFRQPVEEFPARFNMSIGAD
jgi:hypothetical protein